MNTWHPATEREVRQILRESIAALHPSHRRQFEGIRIPLRKVPVLDSPGEFVYVVAEIGGSVLYWSDVEEGWELEALNAAGGINARGCSQFELSHITHQLFGDSDQFSSNG